MGRLENKVAIVTGASVGKRWGHNIGSATALRLAAEGAAVVCADLNLAGAERAAEAVRGAGGVAIACAVDVSQEPDVVRMVERATAEFGGLDILHNNAAAIRHDDVDAPTMTVEVWDTTFAVNARGTMLGCKHAIPSMIARGGGSIINTSSGSGLSGDVVRIAYGASKAAINMFTQYVATTHGKDGIRCNAVAPGLTLSAFARATVPQETRDLYLRHTLLARLGEPSDLASAVAFLASDDAAFITGQLLVVDGGLNAHRPFVAETAPWTDGASALRRT